MSTYLALTDGVSRGRETYGYTIVTLTAQDTGKRYRTMGGGYDMVGTVFAAWLADAHQDSLRSLCADLPDSTEHSRQVDGFYGMSRRADGQIHLDGACGLDSMMRVARAIGLRFERTYVARGVNRGRTTGWFVTDNTERE